MTDRKTLKANAREAMKAAKPHPAWVTLIVLVILLITQALSLSLSGELGTYRAMFEGAMNGEVILRQASESIGLIPWMLTVALDLMTMVISMGYALYALRVSRRENPGAGDVFDAFGRFVRVVVVSILRGLLLSIMTIFYMFPAGMLSYVIDPVIAYTVCLPLLTPTIILSYAYRMADFAVFDYPQYNAMQCLGLSRLAMKGHKWELFRLDLSFLGWLLLCLIPFAILWVRPYMMVTCAGYYDALVPAYMESIRNRPIPQPTVMTRNPGGWSAPGESEPDDRDDDPDDN